MVRARWNGVVIAESEVTAVIEGNHYFPPDAVRRQYLQPSDTHTTCSWKGEASYYSIVVDDAINADAAWYYPSPKPEAAQITDHVAFWRGVEVTEA